MERPWRADGYLNETHERFVRSTVAPVTRIEHSGIWKATFQKYVGAADNGLQTRIKDLSHAKHRFDSFAKPAGRAVLHMDALIQTCVEISQTRLGDDRDNALLFLDLVDAERLVTMGMLADAADESIILLRIVDAEMMSPETLADDIGSYVDRIRLLFVGRKALEIPGYTKFALDMARSAPKTFLVGPTPKSIAGISQAELDRCFGRMVAWVELATATVRAEFPSFEVV